MLRTRPDSINSITVRQLGPKEGENIYVTLGLDPDMVLLEIFITRGKAGTDEAADAEWAARIISMALQTMDADRVQQFLAALIKTSKGIQGAGVRFVGDGERILSVADAIARVLAKYYESSYGQSYLEPIIKKENHEANQNKNP